jgi:hypothetical protein
VIFSVPEDELDFTVNDRWTPVCFAMAAFAAASTELVVSAWADGRADGVNPQQAKTTTAVAASVRGRPKRQSLDLRTKPTSTNLTVARGLEPIGHEEQTQPVACCAAQQQAEAAYETILPLIAGGDIGPAHERTFLLDQAPEAMRHLIEDRITSETMQLTHPATRSA